MKKLLFAVIALLFCTAGINQAAVLFIDDMESGNLSGTQPPGTSWTTTAGAGTSVQAQSTTVLNGGYSLQINDPVTDAKSYAVGSTLSSAGANNVRVTFTSQMNTLGSTYNATMTLRNGLGDNRLVLRWYNGGTLQYSYGAGSFDYTTITSFTSGQTSQFRIDINQIAGTVNLWIDDVQYLTDSSAAILGNASDGIDRIAFNSGINNASQVNWILDDIRVETIPEPGTAMIYMLGLAVICGMRKRRFAGQNR